MRLKYSKLLTFLVIVTNIFLCYFTWKLFMVSETARPIDIVASAAIQDKVVTSLTEKPPKPKDRIQSANKHIKKMITIVFRDFYHFENDLKGSIDSVLALIPTIQILVIYDEEPYPPLEYFANYTAAKNNVRFVNMAFNVRRSGKTLSPIHQIKTKYALILPDSVRMGGRSIIQKMLKEIGSTENLLKDSKVSYGKSPDTKHLDNKNKNMLAIPFASNIKGFSNCCKINLDFSNWTLEYSVRNGTDNCDMVTISVDSNF